MEQPRVAGDKIITADGDTVEMPSPDTPTSFYNESKGYGYVAVSLSKEDMNQYYEAVSSQGTDQFQPVQRTFASFYGTTDTDETRYDTEYLVDPNDNISASSPNKQISLLRAFEKEDPMYGGILDVLGELTSTPLVFIGGTQEGRELFNDWADAVDIYNLDRIINHEYWRSGNVYVTRVLAPVTPAFHNSIYKFFKNKENASKAELAELPMGKRILKMIGVESTPEEGIAVNRKRWQNKEIPVSYTVLDPLTVDVTVNELGVMSASLEIPKNIKKIVQEIYTELKRKNSPEAQKAWDELVTVYGEGYLEDVLNRKAKGRIDPDKFRCYFYKKQSYESMSFPPGGRALHFLLYKKRLRDLAQNIISNAIAFIMLIRIGSDKMPVKPEQLRNVEAAWKHRPRKKSAAIWFQPHTTQIDVIAPSEDAYNLLKEDIFTQANSEIAQTFGINPAFFMGMTDSGGQGYAISTIALRPTIARIKTAQRKAENLIYQEMLSLAEVIGMELEDVPVPTHINTGLENITEVASALTNAFDRGVISVKTYLERAFGISFYDELLQREWENENQIEETFQVRGIPTSINSPDLGRPSGNPDNPSTNPDNVLKKPKEENRIG